MNNTDRDRILTELWTAVLGVKDTDDNGIVGDIKEIRYDFKDLRPQVAKNTAFRRIGTPIIGTVITAVITKVTGLW